MADTTIVLNHLPNDEAELDDWASEIVNAIGASVRETEVAADQYCWRLSINHQHWLLNYSAICESAWLQPLESSPAEVVEKLRCKGYLG
ncbi:MAG: hypothetical protein CMF12_02330 [Idiomarina sp.]|uniref:DUF3630 family protein n=1 Tax=Idiomarina sp. TaxID=1874361 RepID=UPI000C105BAC|nr:DUF3630 family protein [Idiomarina sp.]MBL4741942.1 DUF3630 family protein [Idiomarina sp.]MBT41340.1 hypothetical protein [Idiomarina sp.]PHQ77420.1 MAG: hypothetical protein COB75_03360 [Idiomarina sp.]